MGNATFDAILLEPALDPPPGVVADFANPGGSHNLGYGIVIATSAIAFIAVAARLVSSSMARKFVIEDFLMVAALGVFAGNQYMTWNLCRWPGVWVHQWNVDNKTLIDFLHGSHLGAVYYGPVAMCIKVAILANWLRIFVPTGTRNAFYWTLHVLIWTNVLYYTITTFTEVFRCWPREKIWNPWFEGGTCSVDVLGQNLATSVLNFISDTVILAIPQWVIWHLNMSRDQKVGLSLLFVVGLGAWTMGVVRTVYFVNLLHSDDVTYQMTGVALWTIWEVTTGFLIMGIPAFPRIAKAVPVPDAVSSFFRSLSSGSRQNGSSGPKKWQVMYKPKSRQRRSVFEVESELNTHDLLSTSSVDDSRSRSDDVRDPEMVHVRVTKGVAQNRQLQTV